MAVSATAFQLTGLSLRLVRENLLTERDAERLYAESLKSGTSFFNQLLESKRVSTSQLALFSAQEFGLPYVEMSALDLEQAPLSLIGRRLLEKHQVLPLFKRGTKLFVAIADPTNTRPLDEIKFHTGLGVEPVVVDAGRLSAAFDAAYEAQDNTFREMTQDENLDDIDISSEADAGGKGGEEDAAQIDTPIVRFVNKILLDAIKREASDIHLEPYEKKMRVRFRVDGVLYEVTSPPIALAGRIAARVKILSSLDIAEKRVPQDGRMKLRLSKNRTIDFRVSTLPTLYGEKVVIRILDTGGAGIGLDELGFTPEQKQLYLDAVNRPYGMVLVTGPTGSGKTVTLYTALAILNNSENNICTVEDPVEIQLPGVNQVTINEKANVTFATVMRAFLRQDPDVIMVGEIRDLETADIAIKASQTGHMVLSTLHTNDAPSSLTRLLNMGVAPFNIASAVHLIMAQRLIRRLCPHCRTRIDIPREALLRAGFTDTDISKGLDLYQAKGCELCTDGYKGRIGAFQVMPVDEDMGALMMRGCTERDIADMAARKGVFTLRQSALLKVREGITSLEEVERVTNL